VSDRYSSRPWHLIVSTFLLFLGAITVTLNGWFWFSVMVFLLGAGSGVWIIFAGMWEAHAAYWDSLTHFAEILNNTSNPNVWSALGFTKPESFKTVITTDTSTPYKQTSIFQMGCTQPQFQTLADSVLMGRSMSEGEWCGSGKIFSTPVFRSLKRDLEKHGLIKMKIANAPRQGYVLTRKGRLFFTEHASEGIRTMLLEQQQAESNLLRQDIPLGQLPIIKGIP